ncbi:YdcF family protein [Pseudomonas oryzihabitans]|uniref:YdcF family protein n=1 Tax=Pseudomonas oryzihabitans TaxID=47885 RepID=UPI0015E30DE7|nr:YdcF family protein [Pseudomonas psychrotolerans]MBA1258095.1 YdcF family protein [Pseudomonas psychrotolerans]
MGLRYFFKQLLLPPGGLLLLLLLGWWLRRRYPRLGLVCFLGGLLGLWASTLPVVVETGGRLLERDAALPEARWATLAQQADAIVVLGAGREVEDPGWAGDAASHLAVERLRYAARLAKASGLPVLITGGSPHDRPLSEAALMTEVMERDLGVPVRWQEGGSRTTWENATLSAPLLREAGVKRVVLVTQAYHMARSRWCFERQGFAVVAAPMGFIGVVNARPFGGWLPEAKAVEQTAQLLNEAAGLLLYPLAYR